jgi:hypothetical protein
MMTMRDKQKDETYESSSCDFPCIVTEYLPILSCTGKFLDFLALAGGRRTALIDLFPHSCTMSEASYRVHPI